MSATQEKKPKLMDQMRHAIRVRHYSYATEKTYVHWVVDFIHFHQKRHPAEMKEPEVRAYLTHLAADRNVAASTQKQALCAIVFLYRHVLKLPLEEIGDYVWAKKPPKLPVVLTREEVAAVLGLMKGVQRLIARLMYGTGMRISEALRLRVHDLDFDRGIITIRDAKGSKDRTCTLPECLHDDLEAQLRHAAELHRKDLADGYGTVELPYALSRKYRNADREWGWQFVFPSWNLSVDPRSDVKRRHHVFPSTVQRAIRKAAQEAGIVKHVKSHSMRHSFATHLLENGTDIRTIQQLLGHRHLETTMIYTHVICRGALGVASPLDSIPASTPPTPTAIANCNDTDSGAASRTACSRTREGETAKACSETSGETVRKAHASEESGDAVAPSTPDASSHVVSLLKACWRLLHGAAALLLALFLPWKANMS